MTVGENLKRARKKLNLELDDVVEATKIAKMFLIALENDEISCLPGGVYAKNFLRTYAKFLKIDEDIITAEYHEQFSVKPHFVAQMEQTKMDDLHFRKQKQRLLLIIFLIMIILGSAIYFYWDALRNLTFGLDEPEVSTGRSTEADTRKLPSRSPAASGAVNTTPERDPDKMTPVREGEPSGEMVLPHGNETGESDPVEGPPLQEDGDRALSVAAGGDETKALLVAAGGDDTKVLPVEAGDGHETTDTLGATERPQVESDEDIPGVEEIGSPVYLPARQLSGLEWTPPDQVPLTLDGMFAIEALANVWVQVIIDGNSVTERFLKRGEARYYKYGTRNSLNIGDTSKIALQDGTRFREQADKRNLTMVIAFPAGGLFSALDAKINKLVQEQED